MPISKIVRISVVICIGIVCFFFGKEITFTEQWILYEALRNTSAIIFGVMGAWLAIVYPGSLSDILKAQRETDKAVDKLIYPMVYSTLILIVVLTIGITVPILKQIPILVAHYKLFRSLSYSLLSILTTLQVWTLIITLLPADMLRREVSKHKKSKKLREKIFSRTQNDK